MYIETWSHFKGIGLQNDLMPKRNAVKQIVGRSDIVTVTTQEAWTGDTVILYPGSCQLHSY